MNPYLSPTVMPDGSARRPIVERVPECRPKDDGTLPLTFVEGCVLKERRSGATVAEIAKKNGCTKDRVRNLLRKAEAKAVPHISILRVACEDWLRSTACDGYLMLMSITYAGPRQKVFYSGEVMEGRDEDDCEFYGETINHALNAAAHAVADALGVEP